MAVFLFGIVCLVVWLVAGFTGVGGLFPGSVLCGLGGVLFVVCATMVLVLGWVCLLRFDVMCGFGFRCCFAVVGFVVNDLLAWLRWVVLGWYSSGFGVVFGRFASFGFGFWW